jgi:predicted Zn-dependent protease
MRRRCRRAAAALLLLGLATRAAASPDERTLGRTFLLEARAELPLVEDPAVREYVEGIGTRLVKVLGPQPFDYRFFVVQDPSLNAFSVPGGFVFVFTGLLARVKTDDELAGVLGHEIGHAHAHHIVRMETQTMGWSAAQLLGMVLSAVNPVLGAGAVAAAQTAQLKYSRDFEQEADYLGLRFTSEAGYDPHALGAFFKTLLADQQLNPTSIPPYMLSHPLTEERVAKVDTIISAEKLKTPAGRPAASPVLAEVRAIARALAGPAETVVDEYKRAAEQRPDDAERQFLLGRVYQTVGQLAAARAAFEQAQKLGGLGERVDRPLGAVYADLKMPEQAEAALRRYLARHPDDAYALLQMGKARAARGDDDGALRELERALIVDPELEEAQRLAGLAFGRRGNEADGFYHLALASRLRGDLVQSLSQFERAAPLFPAGTARKQEVEQAIAELRPIVAEMEREREARRRGRQGLGTPRPR